MDFKNVKSYVDSLIIQGLSKTREDFVRFHIGTAIFESKNFEEVLSNSDKIRKQLHRLGCFKSVEVLIDSREGLIKNNAINASAKYSVLFLINFSN
jgi:hypothetical protein